MIIGIRAHDFGKLPLEKLVEEINGKGFTAVQLALNKAVEGINSGSGTLNPGMGQYIGDTFRKNNIRIAVMGCYINPIEPDENERRISLDRFKEHIRYARDFGCNIVATETGSINQDWSFNIENNSEQTWQKMVVSIKELVNEAEKFGVFVGIEGVIRHIVNSPSKIKRLLDTIDSNNLQVIFDPVNLLDMDNYQRQDEIIRECIEMFGDRIVIVHAKDFVIQDNELKIVAPGKGLLNYELLMELMMIRKPYIHFLMEDIAKEYMEESALFLRKMSIQV